MRKIAFILFVLCMVACKNTEEKPKSEVGKYVYVDREGVLHIKQRCTKFILKDEQDFGVKRISSENIPPEYLENCCSYCINDEAYDILESKVEKFKEDMDLGLE